jgi:hypothetical protein
VLSAGLVNTFWSFVVMASGVTVGSGRRDDTGRQGLRD